MDSKKKLGAKPVALDNAELDAVIGGLTEHSERKKRTYKCRACGYYFKTDSGLVMEKCPICNTDADCLNHGVAVDTCP